MNGKFELLSFNRGVVSRYALARLDLKRLAVSAEEQTNWMSRALGPMSLRPGLQFMGAVPGHARMLPFVFSIDDKAIVELTDELMRVWVNGAPVSRVAVTAAVSNGAFTTDLAGWTDHDEVGAASAWLAGSMGLTGDGANAAIREQAIAVTQAGTAHALRINVTRGPVVLRVGTTSLAGDILGDTVLGTGVHSIAVVPPGVIMYVQFRNSNNRTALVDSVEIEAGGVMTLPAPYAEADLSKLRFFQSGDVIYLACGGTYQQRKIERRNNGSWSIVAYQPEDGPFRVENVTPTTIAASATTGDVDLTASSAIFEQSHVGALWRLTSSGQRVDLAISSANVFTAPIRVFGVGETRRFTFTISGTFVGTVTIQRSFDEGVSWEDLNNFAAPTSVAYLDTLDNYIMYYRLGIKTGNYTSGTADAELVYGAGSSTGVVRITSVTDATNAAAEVLSPLGGTAANDVWAEGLWSDRRGWPSAVTIHDGRLWWAGKDRFIGSVTDQYETFDDNFEGDAGPVSRSIGFGPVDVINWLLSLSRMVAGTDMSELSCRSSSFDEPLTPTNFTPKECGTQGSAKIQACEIDNKGVFVQRGGLRLYELAYSLESQDYNETDLTALCPEFLSPGVAGISVQRQPDTRVHCWRNDGTVGVLVFDRTEDLLCWVGVETAGFVEDVVVLPGLIEDEVYYVVRRTIGGTEVRYLERWALESECRGGEVNKLADSFVYAAGASAVLTGLDHLEGETVVAWAGGRDIGERVVSGGSIDIGESLTHRCAGLPYTARFKSAKLAYIVPPGQSALGARKKIHQLALVLADTHPNGVLYGQDFDTMDPLPMVEQGADVDPDVVRADYEEVPFTVPGSWGTDVRLCLQAQAPRPATVMAAIIDMGSNPK